MTDWTGNGATFGTETSAIPVLPGPRCSPPARHAGIRQTLPIVPAAHPGPREHASGAPALAAGPRNPGLQATPRRLTHQSRNVSARPAPLMTHRHIYFAGTLDPDAQYILDGTLLPCWSWDGHKELYSGKHKTTGMNLQVACTIYGKLAWISDPVNGSRHDNYCREESGVLLTINPRNWIGDKGYIGNNEDYLKVLSLIAAPA